MPSGARSRCSQFRSSVDADADTTYCTVHVGFGAGRLGHVQNNHKTRVEARIKRHSSGRLSGRSYQGYFRRVARPRTPASIPPNDAQSCSGYQIAAFMAPSRAILSKAKKGGDVPSYGAPSPGGAWIWGPASLTPRSAPLRSENGLVDLECQVPRADITSSRRFARAVILRRLRQQRPRCATDLWLPAIGARRAELYQRGRKRADHTRIRCERRSAPDRAAPAAAREPLEARRSWARPRARRRRDRAARRPARRSRVPAAPACPRSRGLEDPEERADPRSSAR